MHRYTLTRTHMGLYQYLHRTLRFIQIKTLARWAKNTVNRWVFSIFNSLSVVRITYVFYCTHKQAHSHTHTPNLTSSLNLVFVLLRFVQSFFGFLANRISHRFVINIDVFFFSRFIHLSCLRHNNPHSQLKLLAKCWTMNEKIATQMGF